MPDGFNWASLGTPVAEDAAPDKTAKSGFDWSTLGTPVDAATEPRTITPADAVLPFQTPPGFYRGTVLPFMADGAGNIVTRKYDTPLGSFNAPELFTPGMIASPLRGVQEGGQEAIGERPVDDPSARGDINNALMFGARPAPGEYLRPPTPPAEPLRMSPGGPGAGPGGRPAPPPPPPPRGAAAELDAQMEEFRRQHGYDPRTESAPTPPPPVAPTPKEGNPTRLKRGDPVAVQHPDLGEITGNVFGVNKDGKVWVEVGGGQAELYERDPVTDQLRLVPRAEPPAPKPEPEAEKPDAPVAKEDAKPGHRVTFTYNPGEGPVTGTLVNTNKDGQLVVDMGDGRAYVRVRPQNVVRVRTPAEAPAAASKPEPEAEKPKPAAATAETETAKKPAATETTEKPPAPDAPTAEQPLSPTEPPPAEGEGARDGGEETEYTTKRGRVLKGTIRKDVDAEGARALDPSAFQLNGGWFIRSNPKPRDDKKKAEAKPEAAKPEVAIPPTAGHGPWTPAGTNAAGETIYQNPTGVQATSDEGTPWMEPTQAGPDGGIVPADPDGRDPRVTTVDDPPSPADAKVPTAKPAAEPTQAPTAPADDAKSPTAKPARPPRTGADRPSYWMNEGEVDEAIDRYRDHPGLGPLSRWLGAYRDAVNENSDGWAHWGASVANPLMGLIHQADPRNANYWHKHGGTIEPTEAEIKSAMSPIKAFATKHGLKIPDLETASPKPKATKPKATKPKAEAPSAADEPKAETEAPKAEADQGPHFAAGMSAGLRGEPRKIPTYFNDAKSKIAKDWLRGWDAAPKPEPEAPSVKSPTAEPKPAPAPAAKAPSGPARTISPEELEDAGLRVVDDRAAGDARFILPDGRMIDGWNGETHDEIVRMLAGDAPPTGDADSQVNAFIDATHAVQTGLAGEDAPEDTTDILIRHRMTPEQIASGAKYVGHRTGTSDGGELTVDYRGDKFTVNSARQFAAEGAAIVAQDDLFDGPAPAAPKGKPPAIPTQEPARTPEETAFRGAIKNTGAAQWDGTWRIVPLPFVPNRYAVEHTPGMGPDAGQRIVNGAPDGQDPWTLEQAQDAAAEMAAKRRPFGPILQPPADAPMSDGQEPSDGDRPSSGGVGQNGGGGAGAPGPNAGKPKRSRPAGALAPPSAEDAAPTPGSGDRGEDGAGAGSEAVGGQAGLHPGGDAPDGRGTGSDSGVASDGAGGGKPDPRAVRPNFHISDPERLIGGTPKVRFARNRAALEALDAIEQDQREPTPEELETMAGYIGWGSFGQDLFQGTFERQPMRSGWDEEAKWLRDHLGKDAWESAQRSIINAHYTDPPTVQAMWDMVRQMGFRGGRILEPSMGIGNFFGMMPRDIMANSTLTGIELDKVTGAMAKLLYPDVGMHIKGYEDSKTPDNFYDLVIGNWPFAAQSPPDRRYDKLNPTLHNYFFLKALDQTRPGGLVVGITSSGTMDSAGRAARLEMAKKGELIAAFRLPSGAFEKYAGTSVVTDIIILRKRAEPAASLLNEPWLDATEMAAPSSSYEKIRVNQYFQANPDAVLGQLDFGHGTTRGRAGMIVNRPDDLMDRLQGLAGRLPTDAYQPKIRGKEPRFIVNNTSDRNLSVVVGDDGKLYQAQGERLASLEDVHKPMTSGTAKAVKAREDQVRRLVGLRKAVGALVDAERDGKPETEALRKSLNEQYNAFRTAHGTISKSDGLRVLDRVKDPAAPALLALERPDGTPSRILTEATVRSKRSLANPSIAEAYVLARNEQANFDIDRVAELADKPRAAVEAVLLDQGAVFRTPGGGFAASDDYLSGNVRRKLLEAKEALGNGEDMQASVDALTKAVPPTVPYFQIEAKLGATWVGDDAYRAFVGDLLNLSPGERAGVHVTFAGNRWKVHFDNDRILSKPEATTIAGHPRVDFDDLLQHAMGNTVVRVMDPKDKDGGPYFNPAASEEANAKVQALREKFTDWVWADPERKLLFESAYNEAMNAIAKPHYDGEFLDMSGMALHRGNDPFSLRRHQLNAIWRGIVLGRGLFAHEVGTGKSYTMGGICVEGRRYGVFRKPLVFAHKANSAAVAKEFQDMYPGGKFFYIDNLSPDTIAANLHRIANEDWDAVIMPHSLIDRMALSRETLMELAAEQIAELENEAIEAAQESDITLTPEMMGDKEAMKKVRNPTAKDLVRQRNAIIANIEKQAARASKEGAVAFEKLGVDAIIVDEAHVFKKPPFATKMRLRGLNTSASDRSIGLDFLTKYVKRNNNGRGVFLFTGTPVTNTLNEVFNMARYFMDDRMDQAAIKQWDAWFNTFADSTNDIELTDTGGIEPVKRLAAFVNVDELVRSMSEFTDVVQAKDMPEFKPRATPSGKTLASPDLTEKERDFLLNGRTEKPEGRPYKRIISDVAEISPEQQIILEDLRALAQEFKNADGKQRKEWLMEGNERVPIRIGTSASNAGLDARLYDPEASDHEDSKINRVVRNVLKHYGEADAAQAIFVDRGYNAVKSSEGREDRFVMMDELVGKLVAGGIPRNEIAIVAGGVTAEQKLEIAEGMNSGKYRLAIGRSDTLGVGVNMQVNLRAMHHMDAPWMPGDLEQRNGRGERQGNKWNTVLEYRYVTEGIDGRRWQVLTVKDKFIKQFINAFNDNSGKRIGNIEGDAADIAEDEDILKTLSAAAGDPRIMIRAKYKADVDRLARRERLHTVGQADAIQRVRQLQAQQKSLLEKSAQIAAHAKVWSDAVARAEQAAREAGDTHRWYEAEVDGQRLNIGADIQAAIDAQVPKLVRGEEKTLATINGFQIIADWKTNRWATDPIYSVADADGNDILGLGAPTVLRASAQLNKLAGMAKDAGQQAEAAAAAIPAMQAASKEEFAQTEKLLKLRQQLARLEDDLQSNPTPPPAWLRHGAPIDTDIFVGGERRVVRGHRMDEDYSLVTDEGEVPYLEAMDENGLRIFTVHPAPEDGAILRFRLELTEDNGRARLGDGDTVWMISEQPTAGRVGEFYFQRGVDPAGKAEIPPGEPRQGRYWVEVRNPTGEPWSRPQAIDAAIADAFGGRAADRAARRRG